MKHETCSRTILKSITWRIIAVLNSFVILTLDFSKEALTNAILMNISGFLIYIFFERLCDKIPHGRIKQ
jgi:hypothetical protein|tara:strand:- start:4373 stop:4579 length:207 start_codon:yes stop_codon:yes gene_type:complete